MKIEHARSFSCPLWTSRVHSKRAILRRKVASSDPAFTVPAQVTIPAGTLYANDAINAAVIPYNQPGVTATITATYPDGQVATITVTDSPGPAPPNTDDSD